MDIGQQSVAFEEWTNTHQDQLIKGDWTAAGSSYPFLDFTTADAPFTRFKSKLKFGRVCVLSGGALYLREKQEPFSISQVDGDFSWREIPRQIFADDIESSHEFVPFKYQKQDINVTFPLERLRSMESNEEIGELAEMQFSIYDFIPRADKIDEALAGPLCEKLKEAEIDALVCIPVSELGHQTMGIIQRHVEAQGIATVMIGTLPAMIAKVNPPRAIVVECPLGSTLGEPKNQNMQSDILDEAFHLLTTSTKPEVWETTFVWHDPFA